MKDTPRREAKEASLFRLRLLMAERLERTERRILDANPALPEVPCPKI